MRTPSHPLRRVLLTLAVLASTLLATASAGSAVVGDNEFLLDTQTVTIGNTKAAFAGQVEMVLRLHDDAADTVQIKVRGSLTRPNGGCAQLRVSYLDDSGAVLPGAVEHSDILSGPNDQVAVWEHSSNPAYRRVKLEVLYNGAGDCRHLTVIAAKTTIFDAEMTTLGPGERWVSGIAEDQTSFPGTLAEASGVTIRWDAATNVAPVPDRGDARITATLRGGPACGRLRAVFLDAQDDQLATVSSSTVCSPIGQTVTLPNFASNAELHAIELQLVTTGRFLPGPQLSPVQRFVLD